MKTTINVGDTFEVEMLPNQKINSLPVCRINGMICFIGSKNKETVKSGETWFVSVSEVGKKFAIITPVWREKTVKETEKYKSELLKQLAPEKTRQKTTVKKCFQYLSKQQIKQLD